MGKQNEVIGHWCA